MLSKLSEAIILSAGWGERLKKAFPNYPKPMVKLNGIPVLERIISKLIDCGISRFFINVNSATKDSIIDHVSLTFPDVYIKFLEEEEPSGTAGAVKKFENDIESENFLVVYGDNYFLYDLTSMTDTHQNSDSAMTIGLYKSDNPSSGGVAEMNENGRILSFIEKPKGKISSPWVNTGIYCLKKKSWKIFTPIGNWTSDLTSSHR